MASRSACAVDASRAWRQVARMAKDSARASAHALADRFVRPFG
jgi:hypothetical protein